MVSIVHQCSQSSEIGRTQKKWWNKFVDALAKTPPDEIVRIMDESEGTEGDDAPLPNPFKKERAKKPIDPGVAPPEGPVVQY
jgi:hypothetical protein